MSDIFPTYSILIPLYNGIEFLEEALQSVLAQTFTDWELLIGINGHGADGGTVATAARAAAASDPRISVIVQGERIRGKSASLNDLVRRARADWVCLLDCDDKWEPTKLAQQHEARLGPAAEASVIGTHCCYFGERGGSPNLLSGYISHGTTLNINPIINSSCMIKKRYAYWHEGVEVFGIEDYDLWLRLDSLRIKFYNVPEQLTWHRLHRASAFNSKILYPEELAQSYRPHILGTKRIVSHDNWYNHTRLPRDFPSTCTVLVDTQELPPDGPHIFIQVEPELVMQQEQYLIANWHKYLYIYTYNEHVFSQCPNARKYIHGTTWLNPPEYEAMVPTKKQFAVSSLCSTKMVNSSKGHSLRIKLYECQKAFTHMPMTLFRSQQKPVLPDFGNNPLLGERKMPLFEQFQFSIIIENSKQINYFTEKIMDCILCKTIPIYYGCPNIGEFFDVRGIIIIEAEEVEAALIELHQKIGNLDESYYSRHLEFVESNYLTALKFSDLYTNLENAQRKVIQYY